MLWRAKARRSTGKCERRHANSPLLDLPIRQLLYAISIWEQFSQRRTWPPSAAVRQFTIADITLNWSRLTWPTLA